MLHPQRLAPLDDADQAIDVGAHSGRSVLERCLALGMNGSLNKPYELNDLHGVLARHHRGGGIPGGPPLLPPSGGAAVAGLDGIPGLDPQCAINDTGISPTLYPRLLSKFRKQFADGPQGLRIDVQERAWERVVHFAHTLKGRAGLLGMAEVSGIAGRLEAAANARDSARALAALQALELCLRPIVEGLGRILQADQQLFSLIEVRGEYMGVLENELYLSTIGGLIVLDISERDHPVELTRDIDYAVPDGTNCFFGCSQRHDLSCHQQL